MCIRQKSDHLYLPPTLHLAFAPLLSLTLFPISNMYKKILPSVEYHEDHVTSILDDPSTLTALYAQSSTSTIARYAPGSASSSSSSSL